MILLTGNTLGERQKQLNEKVNKASLNDLNKYKAEAASNDVDKMFLIDLASKGKNIDFILETLKSGDNVQIARALNKSKWIGEDAFANHINVNNLHLDIFPLMSMKMKKKVLIALSAAVTSETRCITFYEYCIKEKLVNIAIKFLYNAPEKYKQDVIQKKSEAYEFLLSNLEEVVAYFIGNSFLLAQTILETMDNEWSRSSLLMMLHNMYSMSNDKYLDLLEKYKKIENRREITGFGRRISKDIIKNHKVRVLNNPFLYLHILHKSKVSSNSTVSDVKIYAVALLPDDAETFWNLNFYKKYKYILDILPENEKFSFIKKIFSEKYPGEAFEISKEFYTDKFYNMMTNEEREIWALNQIKNNSEILGDGNDYIWYKFVKFDKAFEEIKKFVLITSDADKRMDIVNVLIDSAKTQNEIEILLKYFHGRHMNEDRHLKFKFLEKLTEKLNVFDFHEECWIPFEKLLYSLDVYDITHSRYNDYNCRAITLIYYILRDKTVPAVLNDFLREYQVVDKVKTCSRDLKPHQLEKVFQFMLKFYHSSVEAIASIEIGDKNDSSKKTVNACIQAYLDILLCQSKSKDEIPDVIYNIVKMNWDTFKCHRLLKSENDKFSERDIMRLMKKDATLLINEFPSIKQYIEDRFGTTNWLIQKLKLYFCHDIAQNYLQLLTDCLSSEDVHYRMAQVAVYGILILADESSKIDFLQKYAPTNPKIDHKNIPSGLLRIQQAICAYASVSRPPLPLSSVHKYITGDYVHSCLPIFNSYLMNLPLPACVSFVESLIDKPVSIQKHGLRLAFQCFSSNNLKMLLNDMWKRTKNVSIRKILYKSLYDRVLKESDDDQSQQELFSVLKRFTLDIHQDDDDDIFTSFSSVSLPLALRVELLVAAWKTVTKLPERSLNFDRRRRIVNAIKTHVLSVPEVEIQIVIDEHISYMLDNRLLLSTEIQNYELNELNKAKWDLTLAHLTNIYNEEQLKKRTAIVNRIVDKCIEIMLETRHEAFVKSNHSMQREEYVKSYQFCRDFIKDLQSNSYDCHKAESFPFINILNCSIYHQLENSQLKSHEIFSLTIDLRLSEISRNVIIDGKRKFSTNAEVGDKYVAFKECIDKFCESLHTLLKGLMDNAKYFPSFYKQIDGYIVGEIRRVYRKIYDNNHLDWNNDDVTVAACVSLLKLDLHEIHMIVLRILPVNYNYTGPCIKEYQMAIDQLKNLNNEEVRHFLHEKFILGNLNV